MNKEVEFLTKEDIKNYKIYIKNVFDYDIDEANIKKLELHIEENRNRFIFGICNICW